MAILTVNMIPTFVSLEDVFAEQVGQNAQKPILLVVITPDFVTAGQERIYGEGLTLYAISDKPVLYGQI